MDNKIINKYVRKIKKHTKQYGFKIRLIKKRKVENCAGLFKEEEKEILVATKVSDKNWFLSLIHEYCHFLQWRQDSKMWKAHERTWENTDPDTIDKWISKKIELSNYKRDKLFKAMIDVEYECEKMVVKLIDDWNLPIDKKEYIQQANTYLNYYRVMKYLRFWYLAKKPPYEMENIYKKMPTKFNTKIHIKTLLKIFKPWIDGYKK